MHTIVGYILLCWRFSCLWQWVWMIKFSPLCILIRRLLSIKHISQEKGRWLDVPIWVFPRIMRVKQGPRSKNCHLHHLLVHMLSQLGMLSSLIVRLGREDHAFHSTPLSLSRSFVSPRFRFFPLTATIVIVHHSTLAIVDLSECPRFLSCFSPVWLQDLDLLDLLQGGCFYYSWRIQYSY